MGMIEQELAGRNLPCLFQLQDGSPVKNISDWEKKREEIKEMLGREFAGFPPRLSIKVHSKILRTEENSYGGKATTEYRELSIQSAFSEGSFPFSLTLPKSKEKVPVFVFLGFQTSPADGVAEEILDRGYGIAHVFYQDIAADYYDEHLTGLGRFCTRNPFDSWGKLRIWAWGAQRILEELLLDTRIDEKRIAVMGHSRLGKTALLAGALEERFSLTIVVQSGAGGAALFRGKTGEQIENLYGKGSRLWFNGNFFKYREKVEELPFDQHFLLALAAPRHLYVSSAAEDDWADPKSEFLSCVAAGEAYAFLGEKGLVHHGSFPKPGEYFHDGRIGYHLRCGTHYLSRDDWKMIMDYRDRHQV